MARPESSCRQSPPLQASGTWAASWRQLGRWRGSHNDALHAESSGAIRSSADGKAAHANRRPGTSTGCAGFSGLTWTRSYESACSPPQDGAGRVVPTTLRGVSGLAEPWRLLVRTRVSPWPSASTRVSAGCGFCALRPARIPACTSSGPSAPSMATPPPRSFGPLYLTRIPGRRCSRVKRSHSWRVETWNRSAETNQKASAQGVPNGAVH